MNRFLLLLLALSLCGCLHRTKVDRPRAQDSQPYHRPLTSLGTLFGTLSPAAQNTVRAEAGSAEIADVIKNSTPDRVYYKIMFRDTEHYPPLYVAADGSVLNPDLTVAMPAPREIANLGSGPSTLMTLNDLPPAIVKEMRRRVGNAEISQIKREVWGHHVVYIISFKDESAHPVLYLPADAATENAPKSEPARP